MITTIDPTGRESDARLKQLAWEMFCHAHPHEAHLSDPEAFWDYFKSRHAARLSRDQMVALLKETDHE